MSTIFSVVILIAKIAIVMVVAKRAKSLNRSEIGWGVFAFFLPIIALIVVHIVDRNTEFQSATQAEPFQERQEYF